MRSMPAPLVSILVAVAALTAACASAGTPSPAPPSTQPDPPAGAEVLLRVSQVQALPPSATFARLPQVVVTLDGRAVAGGVVPAIFPGPLVLPLTERQITPAGWARIVEAARAAGLLGLNRDFTGGQLPPGSVATRVQIAADGQLFDLTGDASRQIVCVTAPCIAPPGTPEAFAGFVSALGDLESLAGKANLGQERLYQPAGYAVLVGPKPDDQALPQAAIAWPIDGGFAAFGKPLQDGSGGRCGRVTGADVGLLRPAFLAANQLTPWRDPTDQSLHGLVVRPLLPGDGDPCAGLV